MSNLKVPALRPLPKLILLPLPELTRTRRRGGRAPGLATRLAQEEEYQRRATEPKIRAMRNALDELLALITFLRSFLVGEDDGIAATVKWLNELEGALDGLDADIGNGCFDEPATIDDLSAFEAAVGDVPDLEGYIDDALHLFPWNLLNFWLQEIHRRGWELIHISISSVNILEASKVGDTLKTMPYPIR